MRSDTPRFPIVLAAFVGGLALFVAGFFIAAEMRSAVASPAAAGTGGACYTNWNADTCAAGYTAVSTGVWAGVIHGDTHYSTLICAEEKPGTVANDVVFRVAWDDGDQVYAVDREPCAICCASAAAVGGIGELPPIAGIGGSPSDNYAIAAVLAFVAVVAFAAGGWYARRRWLA